MVRVADNVWQRCCDDRCRPSTATPKRHPNPADQCKSILYPRLESSCCYHSRLLPCCRALAALLLCCAVLSSARLFSSQAMLVQSFTPHLGIRDTWNAANTATQDAGRRTQGGSCRLGRLLEHIHTLAQLGAAQLWFSSGILRIQWLLTGRNRGLVMLYFVCDSPRRFATITRCFPPSSSVRETLSWSRPSPEIPPVIPGDLRSPRGGWTIQTTTRQAKSAAAPDSAKQAKLPSVHYTRLSTGSQDKLSRPDLRCSCSWAWLAPEQSAP